MDNCGSCGAAIPEGQRYCSMCYGDPYYGNDGYYLNWLEDMQRQAEEKEQWQDEWAEHTASDEVEMFDPGEN